MSKHTHASGVSHAGQAPDNIQPAVWKAGSADIPLDEIEIRQLAYQFWELRGCPDGSPDEDWGRAEETLRQRAEATPRPDSRGRKARAAGA